MIIDKEDDDHKDDEVSLRDSIVSAFDADDDESPKGAAPAAKPDKEADKAAPVDPAAKADEKGEKPATEADKAPADGAGKKVVTFKDPPSRWTKEMKETWAKAFTGLDPNDEKHKRIGELRDMLHERWSESEKYVTQRTQELSEKLKTWEGVDKLIQPHMPAIQASGLTVERAIGDLLNMNTFATQRPLDFVKWFADMRKIPKEQIAQALGITAAQQAPAGGAEDEDDPLGIIPKRYKEAFAAMPALISKIQQLEQGIGQTSQTLTHFTTQQTQAQQQEAVNHISSWSAEKDSAGNLKRPHYDTVRNDMVFLLESKRAKTLDEAYDQAVWMNPETRRLEAETAEARRIAEMENAARERANRARGAAISVGGRPSSSGGGAPSKPAGEDIRSALLHAWDGSPD